jgi:hypothetical protein
VQPREHAPPPARQQPPRSWQPPPRLPETGRPLARRLLWALLGLCLAVFAALAPHLLYPDLNLDYPFVDGDSHDWIANGLHYAGDDVRFSGRPPLLPLALALLDRLGALRWWPLLGLLLFLATVAGCYDLAARFWPPAAAFAAALVLLAGYSLQGLALEVMADMPASCLILWSARAFLTAGERPRRYAWSGLLASLSALAQPPALLLPAAAGATLAARRRRDLASRWPWIGLGLAAACQGAWMAVRHTAFAGYGDSLKDVWQLFGFHLQSLRFYLFSLLALLGLPACLLLAAGLGLAAWRAWRGRDPRRAAASLFALLLFLALFGSIALFYRWEAKRFTLYAAWPAAMLIAEALAPLAALARPAGRAAFLAAAAVAVGGAALPLPEPAHDAHWAALWPLPPLAAHAAPFSVARLAPADLARWSSFGRAAGAWAGRPRGEARPGPERFAAARAALYLFDRPDDGGGRYRTLTRLSNALRKPVRFVPRSALAPWWGLLSVSPLGRLTGDYAVYRAVLPGLAGSWLLVTPGDRPLDPRLAGTAVAAAAAPPPPISGVSGVSGVSGSSGASTTAGAAAEAAAIVAWVGRGNAYVVLFPAGRDPAELYLLFLVRATELYVVEPRDAAAARAVLDRSPAAAERRLGGARLAATRVLGQRTAVVSFAP